MPERIIFHTNSVRREILTGLIGYNVIYSEGNWRASVLLSGPTSHSSK